ncbi:DUF2927 domain-containing protein [Haematospirillum sp. 15-248]|uniref:DUF2927 domain-containing protein n=1 Tax=Haematospirillum sp. 15-248 TaxID=2723107 RepID=UPI00143BBCE7|nr:DUF2927 domain-containing protein [Haematospirillum sp. 15-248]NKD86739.1 DUF2927 domain-containing protein [Haematospirillum sp. 15-248]
MIRSPGYIMFRNVVFLTVGLVLAMFALAWFSAVGGRHQGSPEPEQVVRLFDSVAFSGFGEQGPTGQGPVLRRWTVPVTVGVRGQPLGRDDDERPWTMALREYVTAWNSVRGLSLSVVNLPVTEDSRRLLEDPSDASLRILVLPEQALVDLAFQNVIPRTHAAELADRRRGCTVLGAEGPALSNVVLLVRDDVGRSARATCLGHGLAKALGFGIDARTASDVFRSRPDGLGFLPAGRMVAELVYDPAFVPGQPRHDILPLIPELLEQRGMIDHE